MYVLSLLRNFLLDSTGSRVSRVHRLNSDLVLDVPGLIMYKIYTKTHTVKTLLLEIGSI